MSTLSQMNCETDREDENRRKNITLIDSILDPGSASHAGLTPEQRDGLRMIKESNLHALLRNRTNDKSNRRHIPNRLLTPKNDTQSYLLAEFGGIQDKRASALSSTIKSLVIANKFVKKFSIYKNQKHKESHDCKYAAPPEWHFLNRETQIKLTNILSWENLSKWDFDIFEVSNLCNGKPLLFVGWAILSSPYSQFVMQKEDGETNANIELMSGYRFLDEFGISGKVMLNWLRAMEDEYLDVPYHNNVHASDVLQTLHALISTRNTEMFVIDNLEFFCILVAAAIHDIGHTGYNNAYHCNSFSEEALTFNDESVMENYHVSLFFRKLLGKNNDPTINIFEGMSNSKIVLCRKLIIEAVLGTDMSKHFATLACMKELIRTPLISSENATHVQFAGKESWFALHFLMHVADISNCAKALPISRQWTDRILKEFFRQGDKEKEENLPVSPLCDRTKVSRPGSQVGFIDFIVRPTFEVVAKLLPELEDVILPIIEKNYEYWLSEETADVIRNCSTTL